MTLLKFINLFILQWFFIRLTKHLDKDINGNYTKIIAYSIHYWIIPLTGWDSDFKYINNNDKFLYIYKIK